MNSVNMMKKIRNGLVVGIGVLVMSCSFSLADIIMHSVGDTGMVRPDSTGESLVTTMYAVDDVGSRDSRLVRLDRTGDSFAVTEIGPTYKKLDIEGIDFHPVTGVLYAVGGENGQKNDKTFYSWDITDGTLTDLGTIGGASNPFYRKDIIAATFRPTDSTFWISVEDSGLYEMDINTLEVTLRSKDKIFTSGSGAEGLTWTSDGKTLLAGAGRMLYDIDLTDGSAKSLLTIANDIEGLGYDEAGNLYATKSERITQINNDNGTYSSQMLTSRLPGSRDIESVTSKVIPEPATLCMLGLGGVMLILRQRRLLS